MAEILTTAVPSAAAAADQARHLSQLRQDLAAAIRAAAADETDGRVVQRLWQVAAMVGGQLSAAEAKAAIAAAPPAYERKSLASRLGVSAPPAGGPVAPPK